MTASPAVPLAVAEPARRLGVVTTADLAAEGVSEEEVREEKRTEDQLRSLGVRFVRVAADDLGPGRARLEDLVRRQLRAGGPPVQEFREVPRSEGRWRGSTDAGEGWAGRRQPAQAAQSAA
ncbi:hypothetical protein ACI8AF_02610 [Blastococcus sp. SYSU D00669]